MIVQPSLVRYSSRTANERRRIREPAAAESENRMIHSEPATAAITSEAVGAHYDDLDPYYRRLWGEHLHHGYWRTGRESAERAVRQLIDRVVRAGRLEGTRVCDVGCGYGATARVLAAEYGARVTGLTVSARQYEFAARAGSGAVNPRFLLADWLDNDLPDGSFDRVLAIECLSHMADKPAFFRQAHRVLRPGGRLVVCAWLAADGPTAAERRYLLEAICREGRLAGMPTEADCRRLVERSGLTLEAFEDWSLRVRKTWSLCIRRLLVHLARHPSALAFVFDRDEPNGVFALTPFRIWLAYRSRSMRYASFVAAKAT